MLLLAPAKRWQSDGTKGCKGARGAGAKAQKGELGGRLNEWKSEQGDRVNKWSRSQGEDVTRLNGEMMKGVNEMLKQRMRESVKTWQGEKMKVCKHVHAPEFNTRFMDFVGVLRARRRERVKASHN